MELQILLLLTLYASHVSATVFTVGVGKDETTGQKGVGFDPSVIVPSKSDQIVFEFRSGSHSVVQSTFEQPCTPKEGGFNTGVKSVADNLDVDAPGLPTTTLAVTDSQPLWFFDQAGGTCNQGGVLAVNPTVGSQTAAAFKENAMKATMAPANSDTTANISSTIHGATVAPTRASSTQTTPRPSKVNAAAVIAASQVALSSLAGIMLGIAMGVL
ncbi:hypothetical protein E1B28_013571 [Marasmius oreades]|uniref:GPI-anchored cupredoxin n=1 Tax=Marasmius oreades TaxID=181124 RepID=A0A9P7RQP5_9AGAR|nr:uncharacterized protein E1B28_013571 [Marasmius oreades]KAG7087623.1 hypothetical protein E1B28_013571 [Marasmius oreades]